MMDYSIRFAQTWIWYFIIPALIAAIAWRCLGYRRAYYHYSMGSHIAKAGYAAGLWREHILYGMRLIALFLLAILIAKPQLVDRRSTIKVDGIDIMLVLDVSGSMQFKDYDDDQRSRIEVAKDEAIRFIEKRNNDAIGLVIFGNESMSRVPLTLDKQLLKTMVRQLELGIINPDGTLLATALVTAANRLKNSKAASKVMILLTDGEPSEGDIDPTVALEIAKKLHIKIYTIGIGSDENRLMHHPFFGVVSAPKINSALLTRIAQETGGKFFLARNSSDMRSIYDTIDTLEKTSQETPLFSKYYDIFIPFVWIVFILLCIELILAAGLWFGL